jgi:hypothetical protein
MVEIIQKPMRRMITCDGEQYFLSFPELKFTINYKKRFFGCIFERLTVKCRIGNQYYPICFAPNIFDSNYSRFCPAEVCLGSNFWAISFTEAKLKEKIINYFWTSQFSTQNFHFCEQFQKFRKLGVNNFHQYFQLWEQKTKTHRNWIPQEDFFTIEN